MDAIMPLASLPVEIAGRNRMQRDMVAKLIEMDPEWKKRVHCTTKSRSVWNNQLMFMVSSPLQWQNQHQQEKKQRKC
jgi:homoserine O-acetyltransferase